MKKKVVSFYRIRMIGNRKLAKEKGRGT